ncbi:MAG: MBL fold metallo-hydrolase [Deltaproteobacteria bacterium]|nr:MBL fold metallo-hydrolase [Deltaproteobacteria bacterium]
MLATFHTIPLGIDQTYLLLGEDGTGILLDGGMPGRDRAFPKALEKLSIAPDRVKLILITHGHWDHIACARSIKALTGAPVAMHEKDADRLEMGIGVMPQGTTAWGKTFGLLLGPLSRIMSIPSTDVDIRIGDKGMELSGYGIPGKVIHTPGHSPGSVAVILETGEAFVGDSAMNGFPLRMRPGTPIFAEQEELIRDSWRKILNAGAKTVYPAHGRSFPADVMRRELDIA